jgi:cytochrome c-type biogenesis protein CcmH
VTFWLLAGLMSVLALAFVLPPLWRRQHADPQAAEAARRIRALDEARANGVLSEDEYRAKRAALGNAPLPPAAAAHGRPWAAIVVIALAVPVGAWLLYSTLGEPAALDPAALTTPRTSATDAAGAPPDMEQAVAGLAERLRAEPDNLDGWLLLGRAYKTMERFEPARAALEQAWRLAPQEPDVMIEYAEALALAAPGRRFEGQSLQLLQQAMAAQPAHQRGMWLLGIAAMQAGDPVSAIGHWERLQALIGDDGEARDSLQEQIDAARAQAGLSGDPTIDAAPPRITQAATPDAAPPRITEAATPDAAPPRITQAATPAASNGAAPRLTVEVDISAALRASLRPSDVLFVYARAPEGSRMPLAIQRLPAAQLPTTVVLDDSTSMMPQLTLSSLPEVVVGARISRSGQAMPQSGDLEAQSPPVASSRREPLSLTIDRVIE